MKNQLFKIKRACFLAVVATVAIGNYALADTSIEYSVSYIASGKYSVSNGTNNLSDIDYTAKYKSFPVEIALYLDNYFADVKYESANGDASFPFTTEKADHSRSAFSIETGYRYDECISKNSQCKIYGGYESSSTTTNWPDLNPADKFDSSGWKLGVGYEQSFSDSSIFGYFGLILGSGTYSPDLGVSVDGDANGYEYGIGYRYHFGNHVTVSAKYGVHGVSYEFSELDSGIDEESKALSLGISISL